MTISPSMDLLIECARPRPDADALARAARNVRDWEPVLSLARRHGLVPLMYWRLVRSHAGLLPPAVAGEATDHFVRVARRNHYLAAELREVLGWLESIGVAAIAFKGPTLAALAYEHPGLRESGDLDILVHPSDRTRGLAALTSHGCRVKGAEGADALRGNCEIAVITPNGCDVDLHWSLMPPYFLQFDTRLAWGRAQRVPLAGGVLPTFGHDDLFAALALHGARHCWSSLGNVADVANLLRIAPVGWDTLLAARSTRRTFHLAALLAADLLGAPVPGDVLEAARRDRAVAESAEEVRRGLFAGEMVLPAAPRDALMHLRLATAWGDKARYVFARAWQPNQTDNVFLPLPARLRPILWVVRPLRILARLAARRAAAGRDRRAAA